MSPPPAPPSPKSPPNSHPDRPRQHDDQPDRHPDDQSASRPTEAPSGTKPTGPRHVNDICTVNGGYVGTLSGGDKLAEFEPLPRNLSASVEVFLWRDCEQLAEPADPDEAGRLEWTPLTRVPELAARGQLVGAGTLVALLYALASHKADRPS